MSETISHANWDKIVALAGVEESSDYWVPDKGMAERPWVRGVTEFAQVLIAASSVLGPETALLLFGQPVMTGGVFWWPFLFVTDGKWVEIR